MGWKMLKGSETTIGEQINELGVDEIKHFAASIDGGKFAVLVYDGKKTPIGVPKIIEKEVIKEVEVEVEKIIEVDNPKHLETIASLEASLAECQKEGKLLKTLNAKLKKALEAIE